jgi:NitT/TauT family transport system permease protein
MMTATPTEHPPGDQTRPEGVRALIVDPSSVRMRSRRRWHVVLRPVLAISVVLAVWEGIKLVVPIGGVSFGGTRILPRTDGGSLPTPASVIAVLSKPEVNIPGVDTTGETILKAMWYSFRLAALGFVIGVVFGTAIGLLMHFFKTAERALMPYVVVAPTVPILALAPLVATWSGHVSLFGHPWQPWMSVSLITSYLCFLPIATGLLRGLSSPPTQAKELMECMAASRWDVLIRLSLPSAVPYLIPAARLAAAASVVGAVVSEISTGTSGGIGRLIIDYVPQAASDGSRLFAAVIAAALVGIIATSLVSVLDVALRKYQGATR